MSREAGATMNMIDRIQRRLQRDRIDMERVGEIEILHEPECKRQIKGKSSACTCSFEIVFLDDRAAGGKGVGRIRSWNEKRTA